MVGKITEYADNVYLFDTDDNENKDSLFALDH